MQGSIFEYLSLGLGTSPLVDRVKPSYWSLNCPSFSRHIRHLGFLFYICCHEEVIYKWMKKLYCQALVRQNVEPNSLSTKKLVAFPLTLRVTLDLARGTFDL